MVPIRYGTLLSKVPSQLGLKSKDTQFAAFKLPKCLEGPDNTYDRSTAVECNTEAEASAGMGTAARGNDAFTKLHYKDAQAATIFNAIFHDMFTKNQSATARRYPCFIIAPWRRKK